VLFTRWICPCDGGIGCSLLPVDEKWSRERGRAYICNLYEVS
jgi:hypothetical protein